MNFKKTLSAVLVGAMVLTAVPSLDILPQSVQSTAYAAKGGAKMSIPKSAPAAPKASSAGTTKSNNNSNSKSVSGNGSSYAPSKDAKSLEKDAPAANSKTNAAAGTQKQSSSRLGSIMRGIGLFAGGMFLGSMLSHLFGMGSGMFADLLGLLMNGILLVLAIMVVRWLWQKIRGGRSSRSETPAYHQPLEMRSEQRTENHTHTRIPDIKPPSPAGKDYDPKSTADRYRNR